MTFRTESVRILYHQLPTETQVEYAEMEERFAKRGQGIAVEDVLFHENGLEIVIRITQQFQTYSTASNT